MNGTDKLEPVLMMPFRPSRPRCPLAQRLALVAAWSCAGGQTGDGDPIDQRRPEQDPTGESGTVGDNGSGTAAPNRPVEQPVPPFRPQRCAYVTQTGFDWDRALPLGFSAQDILQWAAVPATHSASFLSTAELSIGPEVGVSEVTVVFAPLSETFFWRTSSDPECPAFLNIDGLLTIESSGGALSEVLPLTLHASDATHADFEYLHPANRLRGGLEVLATTPEGGALRSVRVSGHWTPEGSCGSLTAVLAFPMLPSSDNSAATDQQEVFAEGLVARWPRGSNCAAPSQ